MLKKLLYGYMFDLMHLLAVHVAVTPKLKGVHITYFWSQSAYLILLNTLVCGQMHLLCIIKP